MNRNKKLRAVGYAVLLLASVLVSVAYPVSAIGADEWGLRIGIYDSTVAPLVKDVNGDGYGEVFVTGRLDSSNGRIVCVNQGVIEWSHEWSASYVDPQIPMSIGDLNGDGTYEIVYAEGMTKTVARNAEDGTLFWESTTGAGWHYLAIADTDQNGRPYVYVAQHTGGGREGYIAKLKGDSGCLVTSHPLYYPCYGGIAIADLQGDGEYEIIINDAQYLWCFDDDLNVIWQHAGQGESACPVIYDVTGDGVLDVIGEYGISKTDAGLMLIDGATGAVIRKDSNLGLPMHITPTVYDIDKDGRAELITSYGAGAPIHVFDLVLWTLDYVFPNENQYISSFPPLVANVHGDEDLEIVIDGSWGGRIRAFDSDYNEVGLFSHWGALTVCDIDGDGLNEIIVHKATTNNPPQDWLFCYSTNAATNNADTSQHYYSLRRANSEVYVEPIETQPNTLPGFGAVLALVAIAGIAFVIRQRRRSL